MTDSVLTKRGISQFFQGSVVLPEGHLQVIEKNEPSLKKGALGVIRRYDVVGVEHRWDDLGQTPVVSISKMADPTDGQ